MGGGLLAGLALATVNNTLPLLLMAAGGARLTSVIFEVREKRPFKDLLRTPQFAMGLLVVPALTLLAF